MANGADGSVIIDTGLDTQGVEMGAKEIEKRVNSLVQQINKFGASLQKTAKGYASNVGEILSQEFGAGLEGAKEKLEALANAKIPTDEYKKVCDEIEKVNSALDKYKDRQEKLKAFGADQASIRWRENQKAIEETTAKLEFYKTGLQEAQAFLREMESEEARAEALAGGPDAWADYNDGIEAAKEEVRQNQAEVTKLEAALAKLIARQEQLRNSGADQSSRQWQSLQYDIEQARQKLEELYATQQRLETSGGSHTLGSQTQEYQQLTGEVNRLQSAMDSAASRSQVFQSIIQGFQTALSTARQGFISFAGSIGSNFGHAITDAVQRTIQFAGVLAKNLGSAISGAISKVSSFIAELARMSFTGFVNGVKSVGEHIKNLAGHAGKALLSVRGLASGFKNMIGGLHSFGSQAGQSVLSANGLVRALTSLKSILITRIKRTFISGLFSGVQTGIQNLARFSSAFNQTMSNITNRTTQLRNNIAAAVGGLIQALEPVIMRIISLLNTAVTMISQFIAAIGGKASYVTAKKGNTDYAKSLDNAGKSANNAAKASGNAAKAAGNGAKAAGNAAKATGKATKAQEEWNAELYDFDELNRQSEKDQEDAADSGDNSSPLDNIGDTPYSDPGDYGFEPSTIETGDNLADMFERLKNAFKIDDWFKFGEDVAKALNGILKKIDDWINNKFRPAAVKWAKNAADFVNGFVKAFNWELLGKTIADGFNAIFDAINTFLTRVNWFALGRGIGRAIKSWFDNIEWDLIGKTFANAFNALVDTIRGIVTTPGIWASIGKALGTMLKNLFRNIKYDEVADTLIAFFRGIPEAIRAFLAQDPFKGIPQKIAAAINRVIHEVNWQKLAQSLCNLFLYLFDTLKQIVERIDWNAVFENLSKMGVVIGRTIIKALGSINWGDVGKTLANAWNALTKTIEKLICNPQYWAGLGRQVGDFVKGLFGNIKVETLSNILISLFNGVKTALANFLQADPFAGIPEKISTAVNKVIAETDWVGLAGTLVDSFLYILDNLKQTLAGINWEQFFSKLSEAALVIADKISDWFGNINWSYVGQVFGSGFNTLISTINQFISKPGLWTGIGKTIGNFIKGWFQTINFNELATLVINLINGAIAGIKGFLSTNPFAGIGEKIKSAINRVLHEVNWEELKTTLGQLFESIFTQLTTVLEGINWEEVGTKLGTLLESINWNGSLVAFGNALFNAFKDLISGLFKTDGGRVAVILFAGVKLLGPVFLKAIPALTGGVAKLIAQVGVSFISGITGMLATAGSTLLTGLASTIPGLITASMPAWAAAFSGGLVVVGAAGVAALGAMGISLINAQGEVNEALQRELTTGLDGYKRLYETKGPEIAAEWARQCYGIELTGTDLYENLKAVGEGICQVNGATFNSMAIDVQRAMDAYNSLVHSAGVEAANDWAEQNFNIKLSSDDIATNTEELGKHVAYLAQVSSEDAGEYIRQACEGIVMTTDETSSDVSSTVDQAGSEVTSSVEQTSADMEAELASLNAAGTAEIQQMCDGMTSSMDSAKTDMSDSASGMNSDVSSEVRQLEAEVAADFEKACAEAEASMQNAATQTTNSAKTMATGVTGQTGQMETAVGKNMSGMESATSKSLDQMDRKTQTTMASMQSTTNSAAQAQTAPVTGKWEEAVGRIITSLQNIEHALTQTMTTMTSTSSTNSQQAAQAFVQPWNQAGNGVGTAMSGINNTIKKSLKDIESTIKTCMQQIKSAFDQGWKATQESTKSGIAPIKGIVDSGGKAAADSAKKAATAASDGIKGPMQNIVGTVKNAASGVTNQVNQMSQKMRSSMTQGMNQLKSAVISGMNAIRSAPWSSLGSAIVGGVVQGIRSNAQSIVSAMTDLAARALSAAKARLKIHSPSRVFEDEVGKNVGLGWIQGIENTKGGMLKAVSNLASDITDEAGSTQIDMQAGNVTGGMNAVLNGLSGIASTFQIIADTLASIGGLKTPQIAAGTVVPYRTKVDSSTTENDDSDSAVVAYLLGILNELQALTRNRQDNGGDPKVIQINLNGRNLFEVMVEENNRATQILGASPLRT